MSKAIDKFKQAMDEFLWEVRQARKAELEECLDVIFGRKITPFDYKNPYKGIEENLIFLYQKDADKANNKYITEINKLSSKPLKQWDDRGYIVGVAVSPKVYETLYKLTKSHKYLLEQFIERNKPNVRGENKEKLEQICYNVMYNLMGVELEMECYINKELEKDFNIPLLKLTNKPLLS